MSLSSIPPALIDKRRRQVPPDDGSSLDPCEALAQPAAKPLRRGIPRRVEIAEAHQLPARRQGAKDGGEDAVLQSRQHVSPSQSTDNAIGSATAHVARQVLGGVMDDFAFGKTPAQHGGIGAVDLHADKSAASLHALEHEFGEGAGAGSQLDHGSARLDVATLDDEPRQRLGTGPDGADREGLANECAEETQSRAEATGSSSGGARFQLARLLSW